MNMFKNNTIYKGKVYFKFEKNPFYEEHFELKTNHYVSVLDDILISFFNKFYLAKRVKTDGFTIDESKLDLIKRQGMKIKTRVEIFGDNFNLINTKVLDEFVTSTDYLTKYKSDLVKSFTKNDTEIIINVILNPIEPNNNLKEANDNYKKLVEPIETTIELEEDSLNKFYLTYFVTNKDNIRIGDLSFALELVKLDAIDIEPTFKSDKRCGIGFSRKENKWIGFFKNNIQFFGINEFHCFDNNEYTQLEHAEPNIFTLEEAKEAAIKFTICF